MYFITICTKAWGPYLLGWRNVVDFLAEEFMVSSYRKEGVLLLSWEGGGWVGSQGWNEYSIL